MEKQGTKTNLHQGHRKRLRQRFLEQGLDGLPDINVLELLLFYCVPRQDTNPIAHRLLDAFGSLAGVLEASQEDLMALGGLSENAAALIRLTMAVSRRQQICRAQEQKILDTTEKYGSYLSAFFAGATEEQVYLLALDSRCRPLACTKLSAGTVSSASVSVRSVVECALRLKASSVVLAHNHTSGIALPSQEDVRTTHTLEAALRSVDVLLADHIVVAGDDFVSLRDSGFMSLNT